MAAWPGQHLEAAGWGGRGLGTWCLFPDPSPASKLERGLASQLCPAGQAPSSRPPLFMSCVHAPSGQSALSRASTHPVLPSLR